MTTVTQSENSLLLNDEHESSQNGTTEGYAIEARWAGNEPVRIAENSLDSRWRRVHFVESPMGGVPRGPRHYLPMLDTAGLFSYQAAQALRWWLLAEAERVHSALCLDTRLVKYKITYSHKWQPVSCHEFCGGEDRSNIMPDWGKKGD